MKKRTLTSIKFEFLHKIITINKLNLPPSAPVCVYVNPVYIPSGLWNFISDRECLIGTPSVAASTSLINESELCIVVPPKMQLYPATFSACTDKASS